MEILGKQDSLEALKIRDLLEQDYLPYFINLQVYYEHEQIDDADYQLVRDTRAKIQRSLVLVARNFMGAGATTPALRELDELNQNLSEIEATKNKLVKKVPAQGVLHSALKEATNLTGIDPKSMSLSVNISRKTKKKVKKQAESSIGGVVGTAASMLGLSRWGLAGAAGISQLLAPILGPTFLPVSAAMLGSKAILKKMRKTAWVRRQVAGAGRPVYEPQPTPQVAEPAHAMPVQAAPAGPIMPDMMPDLRRRRPPVEQVLPITSGLSATRSMSARELHNATMPLWYFFNRLAYKAHWTRDVLRALKGGRKGKGGFGSSFAGAFLGAGGLLLAAKFVALAAVVAGATGVFAKFIPTAREYWKTLGVAKKAKKKAQVFTKEKITTKRDEEIAAITSNIVIPDIAKTSMIEQVKKDAKKEYHEFLIQQNEAMPWELKNVSPTFRTNPENIFWNERNWLRQAWEWIKKDIKYGLPQEEPRRPEYRKGTMYTPIPKGFFNYKGPDAQSQVQIKATAIPQNQVEELESPEYEVPLIVMPEQPEPTIPLTDYDKQQLETLKKILQAVKDSPAGSLGEPPITGPWDSLEGDPFMQQLNTNGADSLSR